MNITTGAMPQFMVILWLIFFFLVTAIVHLAFAVAVFMDAGNLLRDQGRPTTFVGGIVWALATLMGGAVIATLYWLVHHSTLMRAPEASAPGGD